MPNRSESKHLVGSPKRSEHLITKRTRFALKNRHRQPGLSGPKSATGDSNCRDCDARSLAEPEPNRQVFVEFKHLLRKAATRSAETICVIIGEIL